MAALPQAAPVEASHWLRKGLVTLALEALLSVVYSLSRFSTVGRDWKYAMRFPYLSAMLARVCS